MKKKPARKQPISLYRQKKLHCGRSIRRDSPSKDVCVLREDAPEYGARKAMRCIELFAGAGGLGLAASKAGFKHDAVLEFNHDACETIRANQRRGNRLVSDWPLIEGDVHQFDFRPWGGSVDLISGGPPCQPFSIGGKHRAMGDRRDLFPEAARVVREVLPRAFVFEDVKGLARESFAKHFGRC
jgi:DNA (cytosine-5)-methyltransferase 1